MPGDDNFLASARNIDLAKVSLNYDSFRNLARNKNLSQEERIGFPPSYRVGFEDVIFADMQLKLPRLSASRARVVDIGCGCGGVTDRVRQNAISLDQSLVLVDSPEMLQLQPDNACIAKIPGRFPDNLASVMRGAEAGYDAVICYSVLHYVIVDLDPLAFIDGIVALLAPGGAALIGDIPNISKRRRFFLSPAGVAFHKAFTGADTLPDIPPPAAGPGQIDDDLLGALVQRAHERGCDAYIVPQGPDLPMANRRDDMLIMKS